MCPFAKSFEAIVPLSLAVGVGDGQLKCKYVTPCPSEIIPAIFICLQSMDIGHDRDLSLLLFWWRVELKIRHGARMWHVRALSRFLARRNGGQITNLIYLPPEKWFRLALDRISLSAATSTANRPVYTCHQSPLAINDANKNEQKTKRQPAMKIVSIESNRSRFWLKKFWHRRDAPVREQIRVFLFSSL